MINYTGFLVEVYITKKFYLGEGTFLHQYAWLLAYVMVVTLNSIVNPFIYVSRMARFRKALMMGGKVRKTLNTIELELNRSATVNEMSTKYVSSSSLGLEKCGNVKSQNTPV